MNTSKIPSAVSHSRAALVFSGSVALALMFAGCETEPTSRVVNSPPPASPPMATSQQQTIVVPGGQTVTTASGPAAAGAASTATVIVQQAPPVAPAESMPERPSDRHVWVAGYWYMRNGQYVWAPGEWLIPPREGASWVPPRWEREGAAYRFYDGYWSD